MTKLSSYLALVLGFSLLISSCGGSQGPRQPAANSQDDEPQAYAPDSRPDWTFQEPDQDGDMMFFILSTRMLPPIVVLVPVFVLFSDLGLRDNYVGITLLYIAANLPFVVWIMKGFFDEIPSEYEDSAMVDGYSRLQAIWKIVLPEAIPAMAATAVFSIIISWNEFVFANFLNRNAASTVPPFLNSIIGVGAVEWGRLAAASVVFVIPVVIFTFLVRNHLLRGVTFGAVRR